MSMPHEQCQLTWDSVHKVLCFSNGKWAKGLTKILHSAFAPKFSARGLARTAGKKGKPPRGRKVGIRVDKLMEQWCTKGKIPQLRKESPEKAYLEAIAITLQERGWIPHAAQVAVGCATLNLATKIDFICLDAQGEKVLIELKCGYGNYWHETHKGQHLVGPFRDTHVTLQNQALLQLLFTRYLYSHVSDQLPEAYVMHVFQEGDSAARCDLFPLPEAFQQKLPEALSHLENFQKNAQTKKRKKSFPRL